MSKEKVMTKEEIDMVLQKCKELGIDISGIPFNAEIVKIEFLEDKMADEKGKKYAQVVYRLPKKDE